MPCWSLNTLIPPCLPALRCQDETVTGFLHSAPHALLFGPVAAQGGSAGQVAPESHGQMLSAWSACPALTAREEWEMSSATST